MKKSFSNRLAKKVFATAMATVATLAPVAVNAQDYDAQINNTQATIDHLSAQQGAVYEELQNAYAQIQALQEQAAKLQEDLKADDAQIEALQDEIKQLEDVIAKRQSLLAEQARKVQVQAGGANYLNYVANAKSVSDFVGRADVVSKMVNANKEAINLQKSDKDQVTSKQALAEAAKAARVAKMDELKGVKAELSTQAANQEAAYNQLANDISLASSQRDALIAEKAAYEEAQRIAAEQAAQAQLEATIAAAADAQNEAELQASYEQALSEAQAQDAAIQQAQAEADAAVAAQAEAQAEADAAAQAAQEAQAHAQQVAQGEQVVSDIVEPTVEVDQTAVAQAEQAAQEAQAKAEAAAQQAAQAAETATAKQANVDTLLSNASKYIGTPYVWGGKSPDGFDCSGFVQYVYKETFGKNVGNWTGEQQYAGEVISVDQAQAGDLYLWGTPGGDTSHVAIATGNGQYIHSPQPGSSVSYSSVSNYAPNFAVRVR